MSPVGHSLVGLSLASLAIPAMWSRRQKLLIAVVFVALANLPDWPIPAWGHDRYAISHSLFVNIALIGVVALLWSFVPRLRALIPLRCLLLGAAGWLSHLVLDSLYNHGRGIAIFWPLSDGRLRMPIRWFSTLDVSQSAFSQHNLSVFAIELLAFAPVLVFAVLIAGVVRRRGTEAIGRRGG
jgi:hypothetical protein